MLTIKDATLGRVSYGGEHEVKLDISYGAMSYNHFKLDLDEEGVNRVLETIRAEAGRMLGVIDYEKPEPIEEAPAPVERAFDDAAGMYAGMKTDYQPSEPKTVASVF